MSGTSDVEYDFKLSVTNLTYDFTHSIWDGYYLQRTGATLHVFDGAAKAQLDAYYQGLFAQAYSAWDSYSVFSISASTTGAANIYAFSANNESVANGYHSQAIVGYFPDNATTASFPPTNGTYNHAEISIDVSDSRLADVGYTRWTALHETGHTLGLRDLGYNTNYNTDMSLMSYNISHNGEINADRYATTPMPYDILALQEMYAANHVGEADTTYGSTYFTGKNRAFTIQDTGGTDTFDLSGVEGNHQINLHQAIDANGQWTNSPTIVNGLEYVYIAKGSDIENAIGGIGNDTITGNDLDNKLSGGAGDDILNGGKGNNTLFGGTGSDTYIINNNSVTTITSMKSTDHIIVDGQALDVYGDGNTWIITKTDYSFDIVEKPLATTTLIVPASYESYILVQTSTDAGILTGHEGSNTLYGNISGDTFYGGAGSDILYGGNGNDVMYGGAGADGLYGGGGDDTLDGGTVLVSPLNSDVLVGGAGFDTYLLHSNYSGTYGIVDDGGLIKLDGHAVSGTATLDDEGYWHLGGYTIDKMTQTFFGQTTTNLQLTADANHASKLYLSDFQDGQFGIHLAQDPFSGNDSINNGEYLNDANGEFVSYDNNKFYHSLSDNGGSDQVYLGSSLTEIYGKSGQDVINLSGQSNVTLYGGAGDDYFGDDRIDIVSKNVNVHLSSNHNIFYGGSGDDYLAGNGDDDTFYGGAGDDRLSSSGNNVIMYGGAGSNSYTAAAAGNVTIMDFSPNDGLRADAHYTRVIQASGADTIITFTDPENGHSGTVTLKNTAPSELLADTTSLYYAANIYKTNFISTSGDDVLHGTSADDTFVASKGNDIYYGESGYNTIDYSSYHEGLVFQTPRYVVGTDKLDFLTSINNIIGTNYADQLLNEDPSMKVFHGNGGDDYIVAGFYEDTMYGGAGNDVFDVGVNQSSATSVLYGDSGADTFIMHAGKRGDTTIADFSAAAGDTLHMIGFTNGHIIQQGADIVIDAGDSYSLYSHIILKNTLLSDINSTTLPQFESLFAPKPVVGSSNWDNLTGTADADTMYGGAGNDTLEGGAGNDTLQGGAGVDSYVFNGDYGEDTITDSDGLGSVIIDGVTLGGADHHAATYAGPNHWTLDGHDLLLDGTTLTIHSAGGITVTDFHSGDLGITLGAQPQSANLTAGTGPDKLVLKLTENAYQGDAQYTVSVDGKQVGGTFSAMALRGSGLQDTLTLLGNWGAGNHYVTVKFTNDLYNPSVGDRNLYVESATFNGQAITDAPHNMYNSTPVSFGVHPAANLTAGTGSDTITLKLSENSYLGDAQYTVSVDGKQVGGTFTASAIHGSGYQDTLTLNGNWGAGNHNVAVAFTNDAYSGSAATGDRNLYVESISYNGHAVSGGTANLYSNGTSYIGTDIAATVVKGTSAADTLTGGTAQNAILIGGAGNDIFLFNKADHGQASVTDFHAYTTAAAEHDLLKFAGYGAGSTLLHDTGDSWSIHYTGGIDHITLVGITHLDASRDYSFV